METIKFWGVIALMLGFSGWVATKAPFLLLPIGVFWAWFGMVVIFAGFAAIADWWRHRI